MSAGVVVSERAERTDEESSGREVQEGWCDGGSGLDSDDRERELHNWGGGARRLGLWHGGKIEENRSGELEQQEVAVAASTVRAVGTAARSWMVARPRRRRWLQGTGLKVEENRKHGAATTEL
ncbi:hypothetical protein M0R45_031299 [Rubus argutus]|uniref:Uncharacterized protein n=1 Tax=Rubus argutus TaxID=59490 RepID=A0AAW1WH46_RUBAR